MLRDELQRRFEEDGALAFMTQEILKIEKPDVAMVLLTGVDRVSHHPRVLSSRGSGTSFAPCSGPALPSINSTASSANSRTGSAS